MQVAANGIMIDYETYGDRHDQPLLLIMGLGGHRLFWPEDFINGLVAAGFYVVTFDNRDAGHSTRFDNVKVPPLSRQLLAAKFGLPINVPYKLEDMAQDARALLKALEIDRAHVVGWSMGGAIAQILCGKHPGQVLGFVALMTTAYKRRQESLSRETIERVFLTPPRSSASHDLVDHFEALTDYIGTEQSEDEKRRRRRFLDEVVKRAYCLGGAGRQSAAIAATGPLVKYCKKIKAPSLVVHGTKDPLVLPSWGRELARLISGARLEWVEDMGHDIAERNIDILVSLVADHLHRVS